MHLDVEQILWALILAAHLVLLVVLLGRDRTRRFPFFTTAIALSAARLLADHLLHGKLTTIAFYWQSYSGMILDSILGVLVLIELARSVFSSGKNGICLNGRGYLGWSLVTLGLAGLAVWGWGPWPTWQALRAEPAQFPLLLTVLTGMKSQLFVGLLTVQVGLLMRIFGRRFGSEWRSHAQQIALGLSTYALCVVAIQGIGEAIKRSVHLTSKAEYDRVVHVLTNIDNARSALWLLVLLWWIVWLWRDEPGAASIEATDAPVLAGPPTLEEEMDGDLDFQD